MGVGNDLVSVFGSKLTWFMWGVVEIEINIFLVPRHQNGLDFIMEIEIG